MIPHEKYTLSVIDVADSIKCAVCGSSDFTQDFEDLVEWLDWRVNAAWECTVYDIGKPSNLYDTGVRLMAQSAVMIGRDWMARFPKRMEKT